MRTDWHRVSAAPSVNGHDAAGRSNDSSSSVLRYFLQYEVWTRDK